MTTDTPTADALSTAISTEEWAIRRELAVAYRMFAHWGWDDLIYTHLSARVPGPEEHFLLNPFDLGFDEVTASNRVKVDREGETVLPTAHSTNPAGVVIHSAVPSGSKIQVAPSGLSRRSQSTITQGVGWSSSVASHVTFGATRGLPAFSSCAL